MDTAHLESQIELLERKYQESTTLIARLQQRVESQAYELQEQQRTVEDLQTALSRAQAPLNRIPDLSEQLNSLKEEMVHLIERRLERQSGSDPTTNLSMVLQQLENHTKALAELRREVEKIRRFDDQIALARAESTRLNKNLSQFQAKLDSLGRQLDERVKPIAYLEEQRRSDARTLTEIQTELPELHKKADASLQKAKLVEQKIPQYAKYEAALDTIRDEIRRHREHMDYQIAQRERQLKEVNDLAEAAEQHINESKRDMGKYAEHYQLNRRALASLQDFQEQLKNEQHRFGELQRLAEERMKAEMEKFQAEYEQRWKKRAMELEPQFSDVERKIEALQKQIDHVSQFESRLESQIDLIQQIIEEDIQARTVATLNWQQRFEEIADNGQE